jgi:bifunctional enzyme Fae/Hps
MHKKFPSRLSGKKRYLQVALNGTLYDARAIIDILPANDRIIIEAGTPLIKRYGVDVVRTLANLWGNKLAVGNTGDVGKKNTMNLGNFGLVGMVAQAVIEGSRAQKNAHTFPVSGVSPYIVADMKTMDRGRDEVAMCALSGASAVIALGNAPTETLNVFIAACDEFGIDAMIDMMNVEYPVSVLRKLKKQPRVVILHRGVDEERDNKQKMLPLHEIRRVKGAYDMLVAVAGGDTAREVQSAAFNDADIVVIWKAVYTQSAETLDIVNNFLKTVK